MNLEIKKTKNKGRGVFALTSFTIDSLIEQCYVIVCPSKDKKSVLNTKFKNYVFDWGGGCVALALGYGSLYNHSYSPNAYYEIDKNEKVINFYSLKHIWKGDEVTINYNGEVDNENGLWFDVK